MYKRIKNDSQITYIHTKIAYNSYTTLTILNYIFHNTYNKSTKWI